MSRGLALIAEGALDGEQASVGALAERLGLGERQLRRLFAQHLGASPVAVAQTRRLLFAKQLVHDTELPMAEIALAAGFGSLRRFNETFRRLFRRPPTDIRREAPRARDDGKSPASPARRRQLDGTSPASPGRGRQLDGTSPASPGRGRQLGERERGVRVRLRYRPPYDWESVLAHLRARAIEGVEEVDARRYTRTVRHDGRAGTIEVDEEPERRALVVTVHFPDVRALSVIVSRVRRMFDLGADVTAIGAHLRRDPVLAPLVDARPGLRVPGSWDGFEAAARATLGQQVSVESARSLGASLVQACGARLEGAPGARVRRVFPSARDVAAADLSGLPMPEARKAALGALARAAIADPLLFEPAESLEATVARLVAVPGIGDWTSQMIALRASGEPDALPDGDAGLLRAMAARTGGPVTRSTLRALAERWRPWRAYAAQHLWSAERKDHG